MLSEGANCPPAPPVKLTLDYPARLPYNSVMSLIVLEKNSRLKKPRPAVRGELVSTYGNLTNGKVSLVADGFVIGHARRVFLRDVRFEVNEKTRQFVIRRKKRTVHAFAVGHVEYTNNELKLLDFEVEVRYNPYRAGHFTLPSGAAIWQADTALIVSDKKDDDKPFIYILTNPKIEVLI